MSTEQEQNDIWLRGYQVGRNEAFAKTESANELNNWRKWAQFVYLGGGSIALTDDKLRDAVNAAHDAQIQQARAERDAAIAANYPIVCECGKEVMVDGGVDKSLYGVVVAERDELYDIRFGRGKYSKQPDQRLSSPGGVGGTDEDHD